MREPQARAYHDFDAVVRWLYELRAHGYYGDVELKLVNGQIAHVAPRPLCKPGDELPVARSGGAGEKGQE